MRARQLRRKRGINTQTGCRTRRAKKHPPGYFTRLIWEGGPNYSLAGTLVATREENGLQVKVYAPGYAFGAEQGELATLKDEMLITE